MVQSTDIVLDQVRVIGLYSVVQYGDHDTFACVTTSPHVQDPHISAVLSTAILFTQTNLTKI